jgi:glycosyltransferase involved in cell wall biosynthesis
MGQKQFRICLVTGNHLCHNPRVMKSADALARHGYSVEVLGAWLDPALKARDEELGISLPFRFTPVIDSTVNSWSRLYGRMRNRAGNLTQQFTNVENRWQLGYCYDELRNAAFNRNVDLFIAHSEPAMAVGVDLFRAGRRVAVDMEDWFSEDLLPEATRHRPVNLLRSLERELLVGGMYTSCPSRAMSLALAENNECKLPTVIYNAFARAERQICDGTYRDRQGRWPPAIHWYSQTLGLGRGLEDLFAALPLLKNETEIHLRGEPAKGFKEWLRARVPDNWQSRIFLHPLVTNAELMSRISEHDIGFAGEMPFCRNRDLTVTNKILSYLLAGLATVASDTAGQREVAKQAPGAVFLYPSGDAAALAVQLDSLLQSPKNLRRAKVSAERAAKTTFCWERQEKILLESVRGAICEQAKDDRLYE